MAVAGLVRGEAAYLATYISVHTLSLGIGIFRRAYDTRVFTELYNELVVHMVLTQRANGFEVSMVAARSALCRDLVYFFERDIPLLLNGIFSVGGAFLVLSWLDWRIAALALGVVIPSILLNSAYGRACGGLTQQLHSEMEREVQSLTLATEFAVRGHFDRVRRLQVRLSDRQALNFLALGGLNLVLLATTMHLISRTPELDLAMALTIIRYMQMFVGGLEVYPLLVEQVARIQDVVRRVDQEAA